MRYRTRNGMVQMTFARELMKSRPPVEAHPDGKSLVELVPEMDDALRQVMLDAEWAFEQAASKEVWAITLSGGKDSTATALLAVEWLRRHPEARPKLVILHANTLMDAPPMEAFAQRLMQTIKTVCAENGISCEVTTTVPPIEDDFWVMQLGYGYPPFNHGFRPCTTRMKTVPNAKALAEVARKYAGDQPVGEVIALLLGVRMDESDARREGLKKICNLQDGECGQILDAPEHLPGVTTVAPIINAKTCKVWDLNMFILPELGWPTAQLAELYGEEVVRFGCWMCSLATRVKDIESLMQMPEHDWLENLWRFRLEYLAEAEKDENRLFMSLDEKLDSSPNWKKRRIKGLDSKGIKRGVTLAFRKRWLHRLLELQEKTGHELIRPEAVEYIHHLWQVEQATGKRGKSGRAPGKELGA